MVYKLFAEAYRELGTCEITIGLITNKVSDDSGSGWIWISVTTLAIMNVILYTFPTLFMFGIIDLSLKAYRYAWPNSAKISMKL